MAFIFEKRGSNPDPTMFYELMRQLEQGVTTQNRIAIPEWVPRGAATGAPKLNKLHIDPGTNKSSFDGMKMFYIGDDELLVNVSKCAMCNALNDLRLCSRCKKVAYCGSVCQKQHWDVHQKVCPKKE